EGEVTLWDTTDSELIFRRPGAGQSERALAFSLDGTALAVGAGNTVRLWDAATGAEQGVLQGHADGVVALAFSPDGRTLASGDMHGAVKVWDVATRTERASLETTGDKAFLSEVPALAFAPDGRTLAVAAGRDVQLWDVATGELVASLEGHEKKVLCLAYSSDG